jgi:hypothetical protein
MVFGFLNGRLEWGKFEKYRVGSNLNNFKKYHKNIIIKPLYQITLFIIWKSETVYLHLHINSYN